MRDGIVRMGSCHDPRCHKNEERNKNGARSPKRSKEHARRDTVNFNKKIHGSCSTWCLWSVSDRPTSQTTDPHRKMLGNLSGLTAFFVSFRFVDTGVMLGSWLQYLSAPGRTTRSRSSMSRWITGLALPSLASPVGVMFPSVSKRDHPFWRLHLPGRSPERFGGLDWSGFGVMQPSWNGRATAGPNEDDLDVVMQANVPSRFYGGKGAPFYRLQQLRSIIKVTVQLRQKNGDLLQLLPDEAPSLEAQLTITDTHGNDLTHMDTINLGRGFLSLFPFSPRLIVLLWFVCFVRLAAGRPRSTLFMPICTARTHKTSDVLHAVCRREEQFSPLIQFPPSPLGCCHLRSLHIC